MGDGWSVDDLRLSDPDDVASPGQVPSSPWSAPAGSPIYPTGTPHFVSTPAPQFGSIQSSTTPTPAPSDLAVSSRTPSSHPLGAPASSGHPVAVAGSTGPTASLKGRRGRLGVGALTAVVVGTLVGALMLYEAIASVSLISTDPLGDGLLWLTGWLGMDILITVGLIVAVIGLVRGPRRGMAGIAMAIGVIVTPMVFLGAMQLGVNTVQDRARQQLSGTAGAAGHSVLSYAQDHNIDLGPFRPILDALLDDGR